MERRVFASHLWRPGWTPGLLRLSWCLRHIHEGQKLWNWQRLHPSRPLRSVSCSCAGRFSSEVSSTKKTSVILKGSCCTPSDQNIRVTFIGSSENNWRFGSNAREKRSLIKVHFRWKNSETVIDRFEPVAASFSPRERRVQVGTEVADHARPPVLSVSASRGTSPNRSGRSSFLGIPVAVATKRTSSSRISPSFRRRSLIVD